MSPEPSDRPNPRRPAFFSPAAMESQGGTVPDPAQVTEVAHETAAVLVGTGRASDDPEVTARLVALVDELGLAERVRITPDYLPAEAIPELFAEVDALVLPYRSATASQLVALAHWHGLPVVATRVGNFPETVRDGVDGLLCSPDDVVDLSRALRSLYEPGRLAALRAGVRPADEDAIWEEYIDALWSVAGADDGTRSISD